MLRKFLDTVAKEIKAHASQDRRILPTQGQGTATNHCESESSLPTVGKLLRGWKGDPLGQTVLKIDTEMRNAAKSNYGELKASDSETFKALKADVGQRTELARFIFRNRFEIMQSEKQTYRPSGWMGHATFTALVRGTLDMEPEELLDWIIALNNKAHKVDTYLLRLSNWPIGFMIQMIERMAKKKPLSDEAVNKLKTIRGWDLMSKQSYYGADMRKVVLRIDTILADVGGVDLKVVPYKALPGDAFGDALQAKLQTLPAEEAEKWHRVMNLASGASGSKPTKAFLAKVKSMKDDLDKEWVRAHLQGWLEHAVKAKLVEHVRARDGDGTPIWTVTALYTSKNNILIKGLVWFCEGYQDARTINLIADLCEKSMKKIPGVGPASQSVANACIYYLEVTPGTEATARLSRLGTAVKQKSVQKKVAALVAKKAEAAGITTIQLEERVVPKYGLETGEKSIAFDDYALKITVENASKVTQSWIKPDGSTQKTKPKFVGEKEALKTKFNKVKAEATAMKKVLSAQRDRIDRLFAEDVEWPLSEVQDYYVTHALIAPIASKYIWSLTTNTKTTAALWQDGWVDIAGAPVVTDATTTARLWHPVDVTTDEVIAWRARLRELEIIQPTKQAFREVYLLTDAERRTDVYSNRMAAHMLKQHQMATLMAARGWRYQLMGCYDDGMDDQWATRAFVTSELTAEYLIHTNWDEENWNDAGIYLYVGTDQLRFTRAGAQVKCEDVPARLFSETMREADLFVGVASVGNDPAWHDQGPTPEARNYWQGYSFGVLDNFAETRKQVLESLLPRLKIRDCAHIDGKFLIVDGKLNTYKIHLGSSNILMAPGDRYLCIVQGGIKKGAHVTLPFEGDARLSMIISKALMLAEDDKITDRVITSQFKRHAGA